MLHIFGFNFISFVLGYGNLYGDFKTKQNNIETKDKIKLQ